MSESRFDALNSAALVRGAEPLTGIAWDEPDHAIRLDDARWVGMFPNPMIGTPWYESLPAELQHRLGLAVNCGYLARGIDFERGLQAGLLAYAARGDLVPGEFEFLHHEVIEESRHSQMFARFIAGAADAWGGAGGDNLGRLVRDTMELKYPVGLGTDEAAVLFVLCLIGEDTLDVVQRTYLRQPIAGQHPLAHDVFRLHVNDEARHLQYARYALERQLEPRRHRQLQLLIPHLVRRWLVEFVATPQAIREHFEIPDSLFRDELYRANHAQIAHTVFARLERYFQRIGLLDGGMWFSWVRALETVPA
ncbi:MAG: diiron oxygenase [Ilumatobacteraceae bacterium]